LGLENFRQKSQILKFFQNKSDWIGSKNTRVRAGLAPYLLRVRSMLWLGQGPSILDIVYSDVQKSVQIGNF